MAPPRGGGIAARSGFPWPITPRTKDSHLLGISEDGGKKWTFVDAGQMSEAQLAKVSPELAGKVKLPEKKKPVELPAE